VVDDNMSNAIIITGTNTSAAASLTAADTTASSISASGSTEAPKLFQTLRLASKRSKVAAARRTDNSQEERTSSVAPPASNSALDDVFDGRNDNPVSTRPDHEESPLVIPLTTAAASQFDFHQRLLNSKKTLKVKQEVDSGHSVDTSSNEEIAAQLALEASASADNGIKNEVIHSMAVPETASFLHQNRHGNQDELALYRRDLASLPDEVPEDSQVYQRIPIADFGAAMLRGMGWSGPDQPLNRDESSALPRPHRLGLGAIPKAAMEEANTDPRRLRRQDQFQRQMALDAQKDEYRQLHAQQVALDKQRTLQNGSIVFLQLPEARSGRGLESMARVRARIIQLVGVPGLNMVKILREDCQHINDTTIVKRGQLGELVPRKDLDGTPFREAPPDPNEKKKNKPAVRASPDDRKSSRRAKEASEQSPLDGSADRSKASRKRERSQSNRDPDSESKSRHRHELKHSRNDREYADEPRLKGSDSRSKRLKDVYGDHGDRPGRGRSEKSKSSSPLWAIPNIRVRIVTEKLGRQYFKSKGVVLDVSSAGLLTVAVDSEHDHRRSVQVLDRVPERYVNTAIPKVGGKVIVLSSSERHFIGEKGRLLERDSRKGSGVIQFYEDHNVATLSLDDMAEWCGPLDDDDEH
jgi:G-patch domain